MSELMINRTPELIAAEIRNIKEQTKKVVLYNSVEIGRKLTEAKELIGHGEWGNWLESKVEYSKSTANNLMQIFKEFGADQLTLLDDNLKSQAFGNLSYSQAILLLGVPAETREEFVKDNNVEDMSTRELKKTIEELNKTKKCYEEAVQGNEAIKKKLNEANASNRVLEDLFNEASQEKEKLDSEIIDLELKIKELNERPIDVIVNDRDVDEEVQAIIDKLKKAKDEAEARLKTIESKQNNIGVKFRIYFDQAGIEYKKLLEELENIKQTDEVEYVKYRNATVMFLNSMLERV